MQRGNQQRSAGYIAVVLISALMGMALLPAPAGAAPGETWQGTLRVTLSQSSETRDEFGNITSTYSKFHRTDFSVSASGGADDDVAHQPLDGWSTSFNESNNSNGRCPSYTNVSGEASGTDGVLQMSDDPSGGIRMEILEFGSPGNFPVTQRSGDCQGNEQISTNFVPHQSFSVVADGDLAAEEIAGTTQQAVSGGTLTYEWDLARARPGDGNDDFVGTDGDDFIELLAGDDAYSGGAGDDVVYGGTGSDALAGQGGADQLIGGDGADTLRGGAGNDLLKGDGPNSAPVAEGVADNHMRALATGPGPDLLFGGGGRDRLIGGAGLDRFNAGSGKDVCIVNSRKEKRRARGCETIKLRRSR